MKFYQNFNERIQLFPKDFKYYQELAENIDLPIKKLNKLENILGGQELRYYLSQTTYENFLGFAPLRLNLHTHSKASDGQLDPEDYLDAVVEYMKQSKIQKMIVALTDHDTLKGLPVILNKLLKEQKKYKDIRVVLGCEMSTVYTDNDAKYPVDFEVLFYGLNPFSKRLNKMLSTLQKNRLNALPKIIEELNLKYPNVHFSLDELLPGRANLSKGLGCNLPYEVYGYAKNKLNNFSENKNLRDYIFNIGNPSTEEQNFKTWIDISEILKTFSQKKNHFFSVAHPARINLAHKLTDEFLWNTQAGGQDPGQAFISELLRFIRANGVEALEIYYGSYSGDLKTAFENVRFKNNLNGNTEKWILNILNFANAHQMIKTGGYDNHGLTFGKD